MELLKAFPERLQRWRITLNAFPPEKITLAESPGYLPKKLCPLVSYKCHSREQCTGWLQKQMLLVSQFWRSRCLIKVSAGSLLWAVRETLFHASQFLVVCPQSWAFLSLQKHHPVSAFFITWCVPCVSVSHIILCCVCSSFPFLYGCQSY